MIVPRLLAPRHVTILTRLRIGLDLLARAGVHSVTDEEAREEGFQFSSGSDLSGMVFPYFDPQSGQRVTGRLRRDHAETDASGKTAGKYICPYGDPRHLYFPGGAASQLADKSVLVVFVESEKAALALTALAQRAGRKWLVVATGGCYGWRGKVGITTGPNGERKEVRGPLPDLDRIDWTGGRESIICFDANSATNGLVRGARRTFAEELAARESSVKIADLPQLDGVNGPDDLIAVSGDASMLALLDSGRPFAESAEAEADAAVTALEADKTQDPVAVLDAVAAVADSLRRTLLVGRIVAAKTPGLTKAIVEQKVEEKRSTTAEERAAAIELARKERLLRLQLSPAEVFRAVESYYNSSRRHLPADAALIEALFCLNTHVFDVFDTTPYLLYESATGGCGKTTGLEYHEMVCARAYLGVDPSAAVLYRRIERDRPTWLLDEAALLQARSDRSQEILALFDAGYKAGATVARCEEHGESLRDYAVYCPKVLARIGGFRGTLLDRGIVIHLEKARGLPQSRRKVLAKEAAPLKEALEAYSLQFRAKLERLYEDEPFQGYWPQLSGREAQIWGPLLTHARLAGPEIEARALKVALKFSGCKAAIAVAEDRNLALAQEALEVLTNFDFKKFSPEELLTPLEAKETWGADLAERKSNKARVSAIGKFFSRFRLASRKHTAAGSQYDRLEAIEALRRHTPDVFPIEQDPEVSDSKAVSIESSNLRETIQSKAATEVSSLQSIDYKEVATSDDTLTPEPGDEEQYEFEEEL